MLEAFHSLRSPPNDKCVAPSTYDHLFDFEAPFNGMRRSDGRWKKALNRLRMPQPTI